MELGQDSLTCGFAVAPGSSLRPRAQIWGELVAMYDSRNRLVASGSVRTSGRGPLMGGKKNRPIHTARKVSSKTASR